MAIQERYSPGRTDLTASDVFRLVGLTYRQLNDWEKRAGIIDAERATAEGWRKFTFEEVVALGICARLREYLSIPLEQIADLYKWLLGKTTDEVSTLLVSQAKHFLDSMRENPKLALLVDGRKKEYIELYGKEAFKEWMGEYLKSVINVNATRPVFFALKMAQLGLPVYLLTDKKHSIFLSETQLVEWLSNRMIAKPSLIFPLNDLLNEILAKSGIPTFAIDKISTSFREYWENLSLQTSLSKSEKEIIRLIREREYQRITAHIKGGEVIRIEIEQEFLPESQDRLEKQILQAIQSGEHQSVTLQKTNGRVVRISRKESIKLNKTTG